MSENISVFVRIRPTKRPSGFFEVEHSEHCLKFHIPVDMESEYVNNTKRSHIFPVNGILDMGAKQDEVFDRVAKPVIHNVMDGFNGTIFAYGQTGSGKTFTITGDPDRYVNRGMIPRTLEYFFEQFDKRSDSQWTAYVSYLEIYNGQGYDLLDPEHETKSASELPRVSMLEDGSGNVHLRGLSMHPITSHEEALNFLFLGDTNRVIAETSMNLVSSRSHCLFTVSLECRPAGSATVRRSKLHLVDLAGSERVHKTQAAGKTLEEARHINTSLHFLALVIEGLHSRASKGASSHVPYRNSMITSVLRDSLGGNCKTCMVATISAEPEQTGESISTCRFGMRVAQIKNVAVVNESLDPHIVIARLKAEILSMKEQITFLKGETGEGDELEVEEVENLKKVLREWVNAGPETPLPSIGPLSMTRIQTGFLVLKQICNERGDGSGGFAEGKLTEGPASPLQSGGGGDLRSRVQKLTTALQQRDNEISVLVEMVKKGQGGPQPPRPGGFALSAAPRQFAPPPPMERASQQKSVGGAPLFMTSPEALSEKASAMEMFQKCYERSAAIDENASMLKSKYLQAKEMGESMKSAHVRMKQLRQLVARCRAARVVEPLNEGQAVSENPPTPEETAAVVELDQQKQKYRVAISGVKQLKGQIDHLQTLMEKAKEAQLDDFNAWYAAMCRIHGCSVDETPLTRRTTPEPSAMPHRRPSGGGGEDGIGSMAKLRGLWKSSRQTTDRPESGASFSSATSSSSTGRSQQPMTGNQEADADIMAFYKARDELLRRKGR